MLAVKRVVGLPQETVRIGDGQVFINGNLARKTLAEQLALAIPVHDSSFEPVSAKTAPRWRPERGNTGWIGHLGRFVHAEAEAAGGIDWLTYHHVVNIRGRLRESPVTSQLAYNQWPAAGGRRGAAVCDVAMSLRIRRVWGDGWIWLRAADGAREMWFAAHPWRRRYRVVRDGVQILSDRPLPEWGENVRFIVSLIDSQFLVAMGGRTLVCVPLEWPEGGPPGIPTPLSIGCRGLGVEVDQLQVFRDIYYGRPARGEGRWAVDRPVRLGKDEFFVLGDNSSASDDSRSWLPGPGVRRDWLIGKPFLVHWPGRRIRVGARFQLPDITQIRYIR